MTDATLTFQGRITGALVAEYSRQFVTNYHLAPYIDRTAPTWFIGMYNDADLRAVVHHRGMAVQVWCGSDAEHNLRIPEMAELLRAPHIAHVSTSKATAAALDLVDLPHRSLPIHWVDVPRFSHPCPPGDSVYVYCGQKGREPIYCVDLAKEASARLPGVPFIWSYACDIPREKMVDLYASCFCGLRLKRGDGMAGTVCEMGLMGRPSIHNGTQPCALAWQSVEDIVDAVNYIRNPPDVSALSAETTEYLSMPEGWNTPAFWETWP